MRFKARSTFAAAAAAALVLSTASLAAASSVDVAVVDVTAPTKQVTVEAGGAPVPITISAVVTGNQVGTATFELNQNWTLKDGVFTGSNPKEFTVAPRGATDPATTFSTSGSVTVDAAQVAGDFDLTVGASDITNTNSTGAKLSAGAAGSYSVIVTTPSGPSDTTPPVVSYVLDPALPDGQSGWYKRDVSLTWTVTEDESPASLVKTGCVDQNITADQAETTYTCSAKSNGGSADTVTATIKRDATAPSITWASGSPADGATYFFGDSLPPADCTAEDATSGFAADDCVVTGGGSTVGTHTLTATSIDRAGNTATETRTYEVKAWSLNGFFRPVDGAGTLNTAKGGSTVPLKFTLAKDVPVTALSAGQYSFKVGTISCGSDGAVGDEIEQYSTGNTTLRYDSTAGQWIQNWATPKVTVKTCYKVVFTAGGSSAEALFELRK